MTWRCYVQAFLNEFNTRHEKSVVAVEPDVMKVFESYTWPGNVRELRNVVERATIIAKGEFVESSTSRQH